MGKGRMTMQRPGAALGHWVGAALGGTTLHNNLQRGLGIWGTNGSLNLGGGGACLELQGFRTGCLLLGL